MTNGIKSICRHIAQGTKVSTVLITPLSIFANSTAASYAYVNAT